MGIRAHPRLATGKTSKGHYGTQSLGCAGQTVRPSLHSISHQSYSITSSARSRIAVGNTIPNLFAVLRLITSSNFTGNSAGTSAGFEPRNTFATIGAP